MGLVDLIPMSVRIATMYTKASKIAKLEGKSSQEKVSMILKEENKWKGKSGFDPKSVGQTQAIAVCIGLKDMGRIYNSLNSPENALRCLNAIGDSLTVAMNNLPNDKYNDGKRQSAYEAQIFAWLYEAIANAQLNQVEKCKAIFDNINRSLNSRLEKDPANKRLEDLYGHAIYQTYTAFVKIAKRFPENKQQAYQACLDLLKEFDKRDPGNEQINEYIDKFHNA